MNFHEIEDHQSGKSRREYAYKQSCFGFLNLKGRESSSQVDGGDISFYHLGCNEL